MSGDGRQRGVIRLSGGQPTRERGAREPRACAVDLTGRHPVPRSRGRAFSK